MFYACFDSSGKLEGGIYDSLVHPPITISVPFLPEGAPEDLPEDEWPTREQFVRRNDAVPSAAVEISEADVGAILGAPQYVRWDWAVGALSRLPVPDLTEVLPEINDRQFGEGLWRLGLISYDEFLDFVGPGKIPLALEEILKSLPDDDTGGPTPRKLARGLLTGAKSYQFANPLVETIREVKRWTDAELRAHWRAWALL